MRTQRPSQAEEPTAPGQTGGEGTDPRCPERTSADDPGPSAEGPTGLCPPAGGARRHLGRRPRGPAPRRALWAGALLLWLGVAAAVAMRSRLTETRGPEGDRSPSPTRAGAGAVPGPRGRRDVRGMSSDGGPLEGARVSLSIPGEGGAAVDGTGSTDARGRARIGGLPDGLASVTVEMPGFGRATRPARIARGAGSLELRLRPGAHLDGQVVDEQGEPVVEARVRVWPALDDATAPWEARVDEAGEFAFDTLWPGRIRFAVTARGFEDVTRRGRADGARVRVMMRRTGEIGGVVHGPRGGPGTGAKVVLAGSGVWPPRQVPVDEDGRFRFSGVPAGVYEVRASRADEVAEPREGILLGAGQRARVELVLAPGRTLQGRVVSAADDTPVAGAQVLVAEEALTFSPAAVTTDEDGRFAVTGLRPLPHRVTVRAGGFVAVVGERHTPGPETVTVALRRGSLLAGVVVDEDGDPVAGARVEVLGTTEDGAPLVFSGDDGAFRAALFEAQREGPLPLGASGELGVTLGEVPPIPPVPGSATAGVTPTGAAFRTDAQGRFRLSGVPPGRVTLVARHPDHAPGTGPTLFAAAGAVHEDLRIVLPRGGRIDGRVVDSRGFPVPMVRVELRCEGEPFPRFALADDHGEFTFDGALRTSTLTAYPTDRPATRRTITVSSSRTYRVTLRLEGELATLRMRTVDERGFPIPGVMVTLRSLRARTPLRRAARSAEDGTLQFGALPPPPYGIRAEHADYASPPPAPVRSTDHEVTLTLRSAVSLTGRLLDDWDGSPLPGGDLSLEAAGGGEEPRRAHSGSQGYFEFSRVPTGAYTLLAEAAGHLPVNVEAHVVASGPARTDLDVRDVRLAPGGSVSGSVVDALGAPVTGAQVTAGDPPAWGAAARSGPRGHFRLAGLPPGEVQVSARHPAAGESTQGPVRVIAKRDTPGLRIHLPERYDASRVDPGPGPRNGVAAALVDRHGTVVVASVSAGSRARRAGLRPGDVLLSVDDEAVVNAVHGRGMLRGPVGTDAIVRVRRGRRTLRLAVPREPWTPPPRRAPRRR